MNALQCAFSSESSKRDALQLSDILEKAEKRPVVLHSPECLESIFAPAGVAVPIEKDSMYNRIFRFPYLSPMGDTVFDPASLLFSTANLNRKSFRAYPMSVFFHLTHTCPQESWMYDSTLHFVQIYPLIVAASSCPS